MLKIVELIENLQVCFSCISLSEYRSLPWPNHVKSATYSAKNTELNVKNLSNRFCFSLQPLGIVFLSRKARENICFCETVLRFYVDVVIFQLDCESSALKAPRASPLSSPPCVLTSQQHSTGPGLDTGAPLTTRVDAQKPKQRSSAHARGKKDEGS